MIGLDKIAHFFVGWAICASLIPFIGLYSILPLTILAAGKELYDATGRGTPDKWDFLYTLFGGICAILFNFILRYVFI